MNNNMIYVAENDERGQPEALYRFTLTGQAQAEYLTTDGLWVSDAGLWSILDDLHNPFYAEITAAEAQQVAFSFTLVNATRTPQPIAA